jgi:hypothetical protein
VETSEVCWINHELSESKWIRTPAEPVAPPVLRSFFRFFPAAVVGVPVEAVGEASSVRIGAGTGLTESFLPLPCDDGRPTPEKGGVETSTGGAGAAKDVGVPIVAGDGALAVFNMAAGLGAVGVAALGVTAYAGEGAESGIPFGMIGIGGGGRPAARAAWVAC